MTRKLYTHDSIERALAHHVETHTISDFYYVPGSRSWTIAANGATNGGMTDGEAFAMCVGLAAGERHWRGELDVERNRRKRKPTYVTLPVEDHETA